MRPISSPSRSETGFKLGSETYSFLKAFHMATGWWTVVIFLAGGNSGTAVAIPAADKMQRLNKQPVRTTKLQAGHKNGAYLVFSDVRCAFAGSRPLLVMHVINHQITDVLLDQQDVVGNQSV